MNTFLSQLPSIVKKAKKRLGRGLGSGRGAKSGRGTTRHQKARETIPLHFEGGQNRLVKKFPLLRGKGRNKSRKKGQYVIYSEQLNTFENGTTVDGEVLKKSGLVESEAKDSKIKIIKKGEISKQLKVVLRVSSSLKQQIEKAGGSVVV